MTLAWIVMALSTAWVLYAYLGYPLVLLALRTFLPRPIVRGEVFPPLSIVIAVHNGAHELQEKLTQTLALEYPGPREIVVSSDGSTDDTEAIAKSFADRDVVLIANRERNGKEAAQAAGIARAKGDVLVFTDVSARLEPGALRALVRPFADPRVGCVSSEDVVQATGGEGVYVRYEMALRGLESDAATLIGLSGSCFAARRSLCDPWPTDLASDFRTALEAARRGFRAVSEPEARVRFGVTRAPSEEWARKVRTVRRGLAVLSSYRELLSFRHGRVSLALWSHKVARFTSPFALLALLVASAVAAPSSELAALLFAGQLGVYGLGALSLVWTPAAALLPARVAAFFLLVNASMLVAWGHHLTGSRAVMWQPTRR
jgi:cellulose synthase/poly-beta-1,6-N-acetylglucosamine synthase-like glycosyltransferase